MAERGKEGCFDPLEQAGREFVERWIHVHFLCAVGWVGILLLLEIAGFFVLDYFDLISSTVPVYVRNYVLIPSGINAGLLVLGAYWMKTMKNLKRKALMVSAMLTVLVFVAYTIHLRYHSIVMGFAAAIVVTVIYGSAQITPWSSVLAIVLKTISDFFLVWDRADWGKGPDAIHYRMDVILSILALLLIYGLTMSMLTIERHKQWIRNQTERENRKLMDQVIVDDLTGVYNRSGLRNAFNQIAAQERSQYIIAMMDLDSFKEINDTYGHHMGDAYLRTFGQLLNRHSGSGMDAFRFGGDEFCGIFQNCTERDAMEICERIQRDYLESEVCQRVVPMTVSIGLAVCGGGMRPSEMIKLADEALYEAKQNRGSIRLYTPKNQMDGNPRPKGDPPARQMPQVVSVYNLK